LLFVVVMTLVVAVLPCTPVKERSKVVVARAAKSMTARGVGAGADTSSNLGGQAKHGVERRTAAVMKLVDRMADFVQEGVC
jgi:hypothetical protein